MRLDVCHIKIAKKLVIKLLLSFATIFITLYATAQVPTSFKDYPLTLLVFNNGSIKCGYYDTLNNILYNCAGNVTLNKPPNVHHRLPSNQCCNDTDGDGVNDEEDKCPNEPGPLSNYGCPQVDFVCYFGGVDTMVKHIFFAPGNSKLSTGSFTSLNIMVGKLKNDPLLKVYVYGHTDGLGNVDSNRKLSTARAATVASYIISAGIDKRRVYSEGIGSARTIGSDKTPHGRAINRSVEIRFKRY